MTTKSTGRDGLVANSDVPRVTGSSLNVQSEEVDALRRVCPGVFTDGKVDMDRLGAAIAGHTVDPKEERYGLSWAGKSKCFAEIAMTTTATLVPDRAESINFDDTENIFIEGENLEALKILQKSYYGKVKMIYIDPPYNTGHDFVYHDAFQRSDTEEKDEGGELDADGLLKRAYKQNSKDSGRYHSNWLNMMYPRLYLARNLLREDGVIFVSIDDNEVHNLRMLMNEIFGEENFVAQFIWKKKGTTTNVEGATVSSLTEFVLCFGKNENGLNLRVTTRADRTYPFHDAEGDYRLAIIEKKNVGDYERKTMLFPILGHVPREGKRWQIGEDKARELESRGRFVYEDGLVKLKIYHFEDEDSTSANPNLLLEHGSSETAARFLRDLMDGSYFDTPKPLELIQHLILLSQSEQQDDLILDFFAGSGTTAHAVFELNREDGGNRKFICVQIPEETPEDSEAKKAGYRTIADITKARIRKVIERFLPEERQRLQGSTLNSNSQGQTLATPLAPFGFKAFTIAPSNFPIWRTRVFGSGAELQTALEDYVNDKKQATPENRLFEILLKTGNGLTPSILDQGDFYLVGGDKLAVSFAEEMTEELRDRVVSAKPKEFICMDTAFADDDALKTNTALRLKESGIIFRVI